LKPSSCAEAAGTTFVGGILYGCDNGDDDEEERISGDTDGI
jgi:hypothetical protein